MDVRIVGIHFAAALVHGQEYGLDTGGGLSHQAGGAGGAMVRQAMLRRPYFFISSHFGQLHAGGYERVVLRVLYRTPRMRRVLWPFLWRSDRR